MSGLSTHKMKSCCLHQQKKHRGRAQAMTTVSLGNCWLSGPTSSIIVIVWFLFHMATKEEIQNLRRDLQQGGLGKTFPLGICRRTNTIETLEYCHYGIVTGTFDPCAFPG